MSMMSLTSMPTKPQIVKRPWEVKGKDRKPHEARKVKDKRYKTYRWQKLRKEVLTEQDWTCQECLKNKKTKHGNVCDHISIRERQKDFWNKDNLQCLCKRCHDRKSQTERGVV